jgi:hypothetical protein
VSIEECKDTDLILGNGDATSGSAIRQAFLAEAGDILTFDWNFLTDEGTPSFPNPDLVSAKRFFAGIALRL